MDEQHRRRSIRLCGYDYSAAGAYFVTIVTHLRECLFGEIVDGATKLSEAGLIVEREWLNTPQLRPQVELDEYVVMPNHFHGIIVIVDDRGGVWQYAPTVRSPSQTVGAIVRGFKSTVTKRINALRADPGLPVWQRNYYERVIRSDRELDVVREYVANNPMQWALDQENPMAIGSARRGVCDTPLDIVHTRQEVGP